MVNVLSATLVARSKLEFVHPLSFGDGNLAGSDRSAAGIRCSECHNCRSPKHRAKVETDGIDCILTTNMLQENGITFEEVLPTAIARVAERAQPFIERQGVHSALSAERDTAIQLLLTDRIHDLQLRGDPIATVPNKGSLHICGSEDPEALEVLINATRQNMDGPGYLSGIAFRLVGEDWEPWMPFPNHPTFDAFNVCRQCALRAIYAQQRNFIYKNALPGVPEAFIATFSNHRDPETNRDYSYCAWTNGVLSELPKTDRIGLGHVEGKDYESHGLFKWSDVVEVAGHLMKRQDGYPERWLVDDFPDEAAIFELQHRTGPTIEGRA